MAQPKSETVLDEAKSLLVSGKRFMALEDYQAATDVLEQSCQLFDAFYGVAKRECADAYLEYGLALVALANEEQGTEKIMRKAGIQEEEEEGDDEEEEEEEEGDDEEADDEEEGDEGRKEEGAQQDDKTEKDNQDLNQNMEQDQDVKGDSQTKSDPNHESKENGRNSGSTECKTNGSSKSEQQIQAGSSSEVNPQPGTSSGNGTADEELENEEATTIEIAWEVLCLAKRLFMTDESYEGRLKLAETLQKIGEISIEWDNNDNAVSILEECLKIRTAILKPDDRLIALTYYHLGLAHSFKSETQQANENFQNAINVIEKRISTLSQELSKAKETQDTVTVGIYEKEINELKELLPDMTMRLDDSKEDGQKTTEAIKRTREEMQKEDEEVKKVCLDKSKPVDDISHLVKRKAA